MAEKRPRKDRLIVKRLPELSSLEQVIDLQVRAPTSIGAPLIATVRVALNATLADVRTMVVRSAMQEESRIDSEHQSDYPLDMSLPFRFVRRGGLGTFRAAAESNVTVAAALPVVPPYGLPHEDFAPRFRFTPACQTAVVLRARSKPGAVVKPCEVAACVFVLGETKEGFPRGIDELLGSRIALHLEGLGRQPTPKQLATVLNKRNSNIVDLLGRTVLHDAAAEGNIAIVSFLLSLSFVDREKVDLQGETALHLAARRGHLDVCAALMDAGLDPLKPAPAIHANPGETPLHVALNKRYDTVVDIMCRQLRRRGATIQELENAVDSYGFSPVSLFRQLSPSLMLLLEEGNLAASQALHSHLLHTRTAMVDVGADGCTALHASAASGAAAVVRFVTDEWARLNRMDLVHKQDPFGRTALHVACALGATDAAAELHKAGCLISTSDRSGRNALHIAAYNKRWDLLQQLCNAPEASTALSAFDVAGLTPLHIVAGDAPAEVVNNVAPFAAGAIDARANLDKTFTLSRFARSPLPPSPSDRRHDYIRFRKVLEMKYSDLADIRQRRKAAKINLKQIRDQVVYSVIGPSPLWCAVHSADGTFLRNARSTDAVAALLRCGAGRSETESSSTLLSLVGYALQTGCYDSASQLLKLVRADAVARDHVLLTACCHRGDAVAVRWLVERGVGTGVDWTADELKEVESPFAACCRRGNASLLSFLLHAAHLSPPSTTLQLAVSLNHTAMVRELLSVGIKAVGAPNADAPVSIAAERGLDEVIQSLMGYGASPNAHNQKGEPALWLALHCCTNAARRSTSSIARYDRCGATLVRAGAPLVGERGYFHPLEMLGLACANMQWLTAEAIVECLSVLSVAERDAMIASASPPVVRQFKEWKAVRREGVQRRSAASEARSKCVVPVLRPCDPSVPKHVSEFRTAFSYLASAAAIPKPRELLVRLLTEVRLPLPSSESAPWLSLGDRNGCSIADHAFTSGNVEVCLLVIAAGSLPLKHHCVAPGTMLSKLQQAAHAAKQAQQRTPDSKMSNFTRTFVEVLKLPSSTDLALSLLQAIRRVMTAADFDAWCVGDSLIAAIRHQQPAVVVALLERTASLDVARGAKPALALAVSLLRTRFHGGRSHRLDLVATIFDAWPRSAGGVNSDVWWVSPNDLSREEWNVLRSAIGDRAIKTLQWSRGSSLSVIALSAALQDGAAVSGLLHRGADAAEASKKSNAAVAAVVSKVSCDASLQLAHHLVSKAFLPDTLSAWVAVAKAAALKFGHATLDAPARSLTQAAVEALCRSQPDEYARAILEGSESLLTVCAKAGATYSLSRLLSTCPGCAMFFDSFRAEDAALRIRNPLLDALTHGQSVAAALLMAYGFRSRTGLVRSKEDASASVLRCGALEKYQSMAKADEPLVFVAARVGDLEIVQWFLENVRSDPDVDAETLHRVLPKEPLAFDGTPTTLASILLPHLSKARPEYALTFRRYFENQDGNFACSSSAVLAALCVADTPQQRSAVIDWAQAVGATDFSSSVRISDDDQNDLLCLGSLTATRTQRVVRQLLRDTPFSFERLTPIAFAACLADVDLLQALVSAGCKTTCVDSQIVRRKRTKKMDSTSFNVSVLTLSTRAACCAARYADKQRATAALELVCDCGALKADQRDVSSAIMALANAGLWPTVDALLEAGAAAAISSAPTEVGTRARRFIVQVDSDDHAPPLLRRLLKSARHLMQIAAAADLPRERLLHIAKHCSRTDVETSTDSRGRTALFYAAARSKPSSVVLDVLLSVDFSPMVICDTAHGLTPLMVAAAHGNLVGVSRIITTSNGKASIDAQDRHGRTALMLATSRGHESVVELLIELGADRSVVSANGWNATLLAIENGHTRIATALVKHWSTAADLVTPGTTAMHCAARSGMHEIIDVLCKMPAVEPMRLLVATRDTTSSHTALFTARAFGHGAALRSMLSYIASHEEELQGEMAVVPEEDASSVLSNTSHAWTFGWLRETLKLSFLIEMRADAAASAPGSVGRANHRPGEVTIAPSVFSPLRPYLIRNESAKQRCSTLSLLRWAASTGNLLVLRALSDLNVLDDSYALHAAAAANHVEACRMLVALRVSEVEALDDRGRTALWIAAQHRAVDAFAFLVSQFSLAEKVDLALFGDMDPVLAKGKKGRGPSNLLHEVAGNSQCTAVVLDALQRAGITAMDAKSPLRRALEAKDPSGFTPFEVALALGCPSAALRFTMALSDASAQGSASPFALPVEKATLLRLPSFSPAVRALLFDCFRIPEALTLGDAPTPLADEVADDEDESASNDDTQSSQGVAGKKAHAAHPAVPKHSVVRLAAPDLRCLGLSALDSDPHIGRAVLAKIDVEHERGYAFRELAQALALPIRIHFLFDSLNRVEPHVQLFTVRRLATSALLGRVRDVVAELPPSTLQSVSLEFVPRRDDAKVSVRGSEMVDAFSWSEGVLVAGSVKDACERAFALDAHRMLASIAKIEEEESAACQAAAANHPILRHVRVAVDTGREFERTDASGREAIRRACLVAVESVRLCFVTMAESVLAGVTAPQLNAVVKVQTGLDASVVPPTTPTIHLVFVPKDRPAARGREVLAPTDTSARNGVVPATLVLHFDERGLNLARCRKPIETTFGAVMRADAATVRVHLLRDAFLARRYPLAINPLDPKAVPSMKVRFEMETGCTVSDVEPRSLAETFGAVATAFKALCSANGSPRHSARSLIATELRNGYFKTFSVTFVRKVKAGRPPSVVCKDSKLSVVVTPDGGPHAEDVCTSIQEAVAQHLIARLREALPAVASDAAQRLHTYLPHANLNVDIASIMTEYAGRPFDQLEALETLSYKRGSLVLLPVVQALSVGWNSRIGSAIRAAVRTVHVAATSTRPSSFDVLADGNAVYLFNPLTPVPVNGGFTPARTLQRRGVGLLGAQALASTLIMSVVKDLVDAVDETAAFACWSRAYVVGGRLMTSNSKIRVAVEPRNVFNRPCPANAATEPFAITLRYRAASASAAQQVTVPIKKAAAKNHYFGSVDITRSVPVTRLVLQAALHGQALLGSPLLLSFAPGEAFLPHTQLKLSFDSLVVDRPAAVTLILRDAAGQPLLRGPPASRFTVQGPLAGDIIVLSHQACGNGTMTVHLMPRRAALGAAILIRLVDTEATSTAPQPLSAAVDVLSDAQYTGYSAWIAGRSRDENAKRRADRIARYFRSSTRATVAQKLAADAEQLGPGVAKVGRRFPIEYARSRPGGLRTKKAAPTTGGQPKGPTAAAAAPSH